MITTDPRERLGTLTLEAERLGPNPRQVTIACRSLSVAVAGYAIAADVNRTFEGGEYVRLSGPNGSGKSTFLGVLSEHLRPSGGLCRSSIGGREYDRAADLVYVPQYPLIFPGMTVVENLALVSHRNPREILEGLEKLRTCDGLECALSAIDDFRGNTSRLSTGQQRVLLFMAANLSSAPIVLLDEPFAGLSDEVARECGNRARGWAAEGRLVIVAQPVSD